MSYYGLEKELYRYGPHDPGLTVTVGYTAENSERDQEEGKFVLHISRDLEAKKAAE